MLNKIIYILTIILISHVYNIIIYPNIIAIINPMIYNNLIIFLLIIVQIDNIIIYNDYKIREKNLDIDIYDRYMRMISSQLSIIIKNQNDVQIKILKNKMKSRSYNDIMILN